MPRLPGEGTALAVDMDMDVMESREAWGDAYGGQLPARGTIARIGVIPHGMTSGRPSVALLIELDDGTKVFAETSWRNFTLASSALLARWGLVE